MLSGEDQGYEHDPESIALDFEMNGKTTEVIFFEPRLSSTPVTCRKPEYSACQDIEGAQECLQLPQSYPSESYFEPIQASTALENIPPRNFNRMMPVKNKKSNFKPLKKSLANHCVFCKNNGAESAVYNSHKVMDAKGRCLCPMLRQYKCPICNADGDNAHTTKYCPKRKIFTETDMKKMKNRSRSKALKF
jgi:hypothetical protein